MARHFTQAEPELPRPLEALVLGAIMGLALGYLYLTDHGRRARNRLEGVLETLGARVGRMRTAAHSLATASIDELDALESRIIEFSRIVRK